MAGRFINIGIDTDSPSTSFLEGGTSLLFEFLDINDYKLDATLYWEDIVQDDELSFTVISKNGETGFDKTPTNSPFFPSLSQEDFLYFTGIYDEVDETGLNVDSISRANYITRDLSKPKPPPPFTKFDYSRVYSDTATRVDSWPNGNYLFEQMWDIRYKDSSFTQQENITDYNSWLGSSGAFFDWRPYFNDAALITALNTHPINLESSHMGESMTDLYNKTLGIAENSSESTITANENQMDLTVLSRDNLYWKTEFSVNKIKEISIIEFNNISYLIYNNFLLNIEGDFWKNEGYSHSIETISIPDDSISNTIGHGIYSARGFLGFNTSSLAPIYTKDVLDNSFSGDSSIINQEKSYSFSEESGVVGPEDEFGTIDSNWENIQEKIEDFFKIEVNGWTYVKTKVFASFTGGQIPAYAKFDITTVGYTQIKKPTNNFSSHIYVEETENITMPLFITEAGHYESNSFDTNAKHLQGTNIGFYNGTGHLQIYDSNDQEIDTLFTENALYARFITQKRKSYPYPTSALSTSGEEPLYKKYTKKISERTHSNEWASVPFSKDVVNHFNNNDGKRIQDANSITTVNQNLNYNKFSVDRETEVFTNGRRNNIELTDIDIFGEPIFDEYFKGSQDNFGINSSEITEGTPYGYWGPNIPDAYLNFNTFDTVILNFTSGTKNDVINFDVLGPHLENGSDIHFGRLRRQGKWNTIG